MRSQPSINTELSPEQAEEIEYIQDRILAKFPMLGVTLSTLQTYADDAIGTAATNGSHVVYSPQFFSTLNDKEKIFVYAHELLHVAFDHIYRVTNKDPNLWNIATDAVINQILAHEGLPIMDGLVNMPEAHNHSAEEVYVYLLRRKKEREKKRQKQEQNKQEGNSEQQQQSKDGSGQQPQQQGQQDPENGSGQQPQQQGQQNPENGSGQQPQQQGQQNPENGSGQLPQQQGQQKPGNGSGQQPQQQPVQNQQGEDGESQNRISDEELFDTTYNHTHDMWKKAAEQHQKEQAQKSKTNMQDFEKNFTKSNREARQKQNAGISEEHRKYAQDVKKKISGNHGSVSLSSQEAKQSRKPVLNWRKYLIKEIADEDDDWSYRRASIENDFSARMEVIERQDQSSETEVMLDISGSVSVPMLKEFLRQLSPLLRYTKLKVGCFNDEAFDFVPVKKVSDIEKLYIPFPDGGTNLDAAVRAFSPVKEVNKIVFTDGEGIMPHKDLRGVKNLIWLLYDNEGDFEPVCGKVIRISSKEVMHHAMRQQKLLDQSQIID